MRIPIPSSLNCRPRVLVASLLFAGACGLFESTGTTSEGDTGGSDGGGPAPFEHFAFVAANIEFNGKDGQGNVIYPIVDDCVSNDVPDDTEALVSNLELDDWVVLAARDKFRNPGEPLHSLPNQFAEAYNGAPFADFFDDPTDDVHADSYDLAVYSGHGHPGLLAPNRPPDDDNTKMCNVLLDEDVRLGAYCGQEAKVVVYSASCVAGINEIQCPLAPDDPNDPGPFTPWPVLCWQPLDCTIFQSRTNHTLAFVDSPIVHQSELSAWYSSAQVHSLVYSWITELAIDSSNAANQPAALVFAETEADLIERFFASNIVNGANLQQLPPDTPINWTGITFVTWDGNTGLLDEQGEPIQYDAQMPEGDPLCVFSHDETCENTNPPNVSKQVCQE